MRYFNTEGPCIPDLHYMLPAEPRLPQARHLIERDMYFVVRSPRRTGKTTTLSSLARTLTAEGEVAALHFSCRVGEAAGEDCGAAEDAVLAVIRREAAQQGLPPELGPPDSWPDASDGTKLSVGLNAWAERCPRPLVLIFDDIDALRGRSLRNVLAHLRASHTRRPQAFPAGVVLAGARDVSRPSTVADGDHAAIEPIVPFNISVASLELADFDLTEVRRLYELHTVETGQAFRPDAVERAFALSEGRPRLVNALAAQVVNMIGVDSSAAITARDIDEAKEQLVHDAAQHFAPLIDALAEPRVLRVIQPLSAGDIVPGYDNYEVDVDYVRSLGLLATDPPLRIANPIYEEVAAQALATH